MKKYQAELGQSVAGRKSQEFECGELIVGFLITLGISILFKHGINPMNSSGESYCNNTFEAHAYDWDNEETQSFNFKYKDIKISWYKYVGRGTSINREVNTLDLKIMILDCLKSLELK